MEEKKIVIDARMINASGIGRYLQSILPGIVSHFECITLLGDKKLINKVLDTPLSAEIIPFRNSIYSLSEQIKYTQIIPKCALFFSPHYNIPLLPIKAKHKVVTIHDVFHLAFYNELSLPQKIYSKIVINSALKKSDKIITVSNFSKKEILKYTNSKYEEKISVIYNGIDLKKKGKRYTKDITTPYFLFVGNIKPHKNLKRTLESFKLFLEKYQNSENLPQFIIVGKKEGFITGDNVVNLVEKDFLLRKYVKFTGWIDDNELDELYSNALALIFPSYYEGFGFPPLEAMTFDCPVIASDKACISEICEDAALYFDPFSVKSIMEKMMIIFNEKDIRNNLVLKGKERIMHFSDKKTVEKHIKLFNQYL